MDGNMLNYTYILALNTHMQQLSFIFIIYSNCIHVFLYSYPSLSHIYILYTQSYIPVRVVDVELLQK